MTPLSKLISLDHMGLCLRLISMKWLIARVQQKHHDYCWLSTTDTKTLHHSYCLAPAIQTPRHIIAGNIQNVIPPWQPDLATSTIMSHVGHDAWLPHAHCVESKHKVAEHHDQCVTWLLTLLNLVVMAGSHSGCCWWWCDVVSVLLVQGRLVNQSAHKHGLLRWPN